MSFLSLVLQKHTKNEPGICPASTELIFLETLPPTDKNRAALTKRRNEMLAKGEDVYLMTTAQEPGTPHESRPARRLRERTLRRLLRRALRRRLTPVKKTILALPKELQQ